MQIQPLNDPAPSLEGLAEARHSAQAEPSRPQGERAKETGAAEDKPQTQVEYTTVTTHCNKHHRHTPACPHTVTTQPAAPAAPAAPTGGAPGRLVDMEL